MTVSIAASSDVRAAAIRTALETAAESGMAAAIAEHGADLTPEDEQMLVELSADEIQELVSLSGQVSELDTIAMDTNNNF
jgi:hypothetical protein